MPLGAWIGSEIMGGKSPFDQAKDRVRQEADDRGSAERLKQENESRRISSVQQAAGRYDQRGRDLGEELFGSGRLSRINAGRGGDITDIINRRRAGLEGLSSAENAALKDQAVQGLGEQTQTGLRSLRAAQGGVSASRAAAQQAGFLKSQDQARAGLERDLLIKNYDIKQQALGSFEDSVRKAEAEELEKQKFNIGQEQSEKYGKLASELGFGQLASGERSALTQESIARAQSEATKAAARQGGKK